MLLIALCYGLVIGAVVYVTGLATLAADQKDELRQRVAR